jgi:replicative DNA helicase
LKEYATGTLKCSEVRRLLDKARAKGRIYDLVIVDYADIMAPEHRSDSQIDNMRSIYIDLRAVAFDYDCAVLTATQSNREGAKKMTAGATDVAEDYNKARTVDLMISINANEAEKAAGEARLFFALSRNSESEFTLRIKQDRSRMRFIEKVLGRE